VTVRRIEQSTDALSQLDQYSRAVGPQGFGSMLEQLVADMVDTMRAANGAGLAAVQIGVPLRVFVIDTEPGYQVYVNPRLLSHSNRLDGANEGCLSVDEGGRRDCVVRPRFIEVAWQGIAGKLNVGRLTGLRARVFLHELDHLNGSLFTARVRAGDFVVGEEAKELQQ
jgi:peptide deformylase